MKLPPKPQGPAGLIAAYASVSGSWAAMARDRLLRARFADSTKLKRHHLQSARECATAAREAYAAMLKEMERTNV